jgi:hypothetical protein
MLFTYGVPYVRREAFMELKIPVEVFWVVTPCSVVVGYRRFGREDVKTRTKERRNKDTMEYRNK